MGKRIPHPHLHDLCGLNGKAGDVTGFYRTRELNNSRKKNDNFCKMSASTLEAICKALDCQPSGILEYVDGKKKSNTAKSYLQTRRRLTLAIGCGQTIPKAISKYYICSIGQSCAQLNYQKNRYETLTTHWDILWCHLKL